MGKFKRNAILLISFFGGINFCYAQPNFLPSDISGLSLWLSPEDSNLILNGSAVNQWNDLSGFGKNAYQAGSPSQPLRIDSVASINHKPVIRFDGSNDILMIDSALDVADVFIVANWNDSLSPVFPDYCGLLTGQDPVNPDILFIATGGANSFYPGGEFGSSNVYVNTIQTLNLSPLSKYKIISGRLPVASIQNNLQIGRDRTNATRYWKGDIAEIIIYNSPLNSAQRQQVEQYLRYKYAPPVNLGADISTSTFCPITLHSKKGWFTNYLWNTGATSDSISVSKGGTYTVTVTDLFGFISSDTVIVTYPFNQIAAFDTICFGNTLSWNTQLNKYTYSFLWNDNSTDSLLNITTAGNYHVTVTEISTGCQYFSDTVAIYVDSFPALATLGADRSVCSGNVIALMQGQNQAVSYVWSDASTASSIVVNTSGTYSVTVTNSNNCQVVDSITLIVAGTAPTVNFSGTKVCFGNATQFFDSSTSSDSIIGWNWNFGDTSFDTLQNPAHTYASPGQYPVSLTAQTNVGCSAVITKTVTVPFLPQPKFTFPQKVCGSSPVLFTDQSITLLDSAVKWQWDFGDSGKDSIQNTSHTFNSPGEYYVKLKVTTLGGCSDSITRFIKVYDSTACFLPSQISDLGLWLAADNGVIHTNGKVSQWSDQSSHGFNATQSDSTLSPIVTDSIVKINFAKAIRFDGINDILFIDSTVSVGELFIIANWGDSLASVFPEYCGLLTGQDPVNQDILLIATGGSNTFYPSGEFGNNIFVNTIPSVDLSPLYSYKLIDGRASSASIQNNLQIGRDRLQTARQWKGDVAEVIIFDSLLSSSERRQVELYLRYKYAPPVNLGSDIAMITLCDTLVDASPRFTSYRWHIGNNPAVIDTNQTLLITNPGKYWVQVTDVFGFISSDTIQVTYPGNEPAINNSLCLGDTLHWNTNLSTGNYTFLWNDNSTNSNLDITLAGQYFVRITENATGCIFHSDTVRLLVDSFPVIASLGNDSAFLCVGNTIGLTQGASQATTYLWSNSNTTAKIPILTTGNYSLFVQDINGCGKSDSVYATIIGIPPFVNFTATSVCQGFATNFSDSSYDPTPGNSIQSWLWNFGDGTTDTLQNPSHILLPSGNHRVTLTVTSNIGCPNSDSISVTVHPLPSSSFVNTAPCTVSAIQFNNTSVIDSPSVINSYDWNFGNPNAGAINNSSSLLNPTHLYDTTGNFVVRLITTSDFGCKDTAFKVLTVQRGSHADFQYSPTCYLSYMQFTDLSFPSGSDSIYSWNFGDGPGGNPLPNPAHLYGLVGTYTVTLSVQSTTGCLTTVTKSVTVSPIPVAAFVHSPACIGTTYQFLDSSYVSSGTIVAWKWNFAGLDSSTLQNPYFSFPDTGNYSIKLTVTSNIGCSKTLIRNIHVYPLPVASFSFNPQYGSPPLNVTFTNLSLGGSNYEWNFGDGSAISTQNNPQHLYNDTNLYTIQLIAMSQYGCRDTVEKSIYIIKPILDLAITAVSSIVVANHLKIKVDIANLGTRSINDFKIEAQLENGTAIRETYVQTLPNGFAGELTLFSTLDLGSGQAKYYCVRAVEPNGTTDDVPANDFLCKSLTKEFSVINPYPNPFNDLLTLQLILPYKDQISIELIDMNGKSIMLFEGEGKEGLNQVEADLSDLANGTYAVRYLFRETKIMRTIIKMENKK